MSSKKLLVTYYLIAAVALFSGNVFPVIAFKVTVDADDGANYTTLDAVLYAIQNSGLDPDTIEFIGSDQDSYTWTTYVDASRGTILFRSTQTNPDLFPIISHSNNDCFNFFNKNQIIFENIIVTTTVGLRLGQTRTHGFRRCVFRECSAPYFFNPEGTGGTITFENCLFEGNGNNIFNLNYWGGTPTFILRNCTFDGNNSVWNEDEDCYTNFSIVNCIFSNNSVTFRGNNLRGKTTYSLTSEPLTGYGAGCVSSTNPQYISSSRSIPSDWKILVTSPARDIGTGSIPSTDISGYPRSGIIDAGCWEVQILNYTWDVSTAEGFQAGNGTWGIDSYWTESDGNGTVLVAWPGERRNATFTGSDGAYTITVNGTQYVDSITFAADGYTLSGGALNFTANSKIVVASGKSALIGSVISGSIGLTKLGAGTLTLTGNNTYTGTTAVSSGLLQIGNGGAGGSVSGDIVNNASLVINRSGTYTYSGVMSGTGNLEKSGSGTLILIGNNTYTGTTTISAGTLQIGNGGTSGALSSGSNIINNSSLIINRSGEYYYGGVISGTGTVQKTGTGALTLTGNNTFTGDFTISSGTVRIGIAGTSGSVNADIINNDTLIFNRSDNYTFSKNISGTGMLVKWGKGLLILTGNNTFTGGTLNVDGSGIQIGNGGTTGSLTGNVQNNFPLYFNRSDAYTFNGVISDTSSIYNIGSGTTTLTGISSYTGSTNITNGAFSVSVLADGGSNSNIGASSSDASKLVIDGGSLIYTGAAQSCNRLFTIGTNGATIVASGTGPLNLTNTGSIALSGSGNRTLTLSGTNTGLNTLSAILGGNNSLTKTGTGTWVLSAAHTYTGPTTVSAGTLFLTGSTASGSSVTVNAGATLGGTGTIGGSLTANGKLAPGVNNRGILSVGGNLSLTNSAVCEIEINGNTAGTTYDQINVTGTVTLGSSSLSLILGYAPSVGHSFTIVNNAETDAIAGTFSGLSEGSVIPLSYGGITYNLTITYKGGTGNDVVLTVTSVATDFFWDTSVEAGFQAGNGIWGTNNYWSADGINLIPWPGAGNSAAFAGSDGSYTITVNGTQAVDSIAFLNGTYSLVNGALNYGGKNGLYVEAGKTAIIGSIINGSSGLKKYGNGTLILTGSNTYSGSTAIESGILQVGNGGAGGTVNGDIVNNGSLVVNRSNAYSIGTVISGTGSVIKYGSDTLTLYGNNTYSGATVINSGFLQLGNGGSTGSIAGNITNNGTLIFNRSDKYSFGGIIGGGGSVVKRGFDTVVFTGVQTYTGITTINSGTLQIGTGESTIGLSSRIVDNGSLFLNHSGIYSYDSIISGTGTLTKGGSGTLILTGTNTYTGTTYINTGTLQIGNGGANGSLTGSIVNNGALIFNRAGTLTYGGAISGSGTVTKSGTGTVVLTGNNTYTGITAISSGTLQIGNGGSTGSITGNIINNGLLIINRSGTFTYGSVVSGTGSVTINGTGTVIFTGNNTYTGVTTVSSGTLQIGNGGTSGSVAGDVTNNAALIVNRSGTISYGGVISGTGSLTKTGTGTLILTGANTFSGGITVDNGTLQIGDGATGSVSCNITNNASLVFNRTGTITYGSVISGTGTLTKNGSGALILTGSNTFTGSATVSAGTLQIGNGENSGSIVCNIVNNSAVVVNRSGTLTLPGVISGSGSLTKTGSGTLIINGNCSFTGTTTVNEGILQIGSGGTIGSISGNIENSGSVVFHRSNDLSYNGVISGNGSVEKRGNGKLTVSGVQTYTGTTTVAEGTLLLTGAIASSSAVTVSAGGILGGTGSCGGIVTVNAGSISPGTNGPGKLTTGPVTLDSASFLNFDLGTENDTLAVNGNLILDGVINISAATGFTAGTYRVITVSGGSLTNNTLEIGSFPAGFDFSISVGSNYVDVIATVGLIQTEPRDTMVKVGETATFSVEASGAGTLTYKWLRYRGGVEGDSVGNASSYTIAGVNISDNGLVFRCVVKDDNGTDTSRAARLTVVDTPRIAIQPRDTAVFFGENVRFSVSVADTASVVYIWRNVGSEEILGTSSVLNINAVTFADSGRRYYCLISNLAGSVSSDTVMLHVNHIPPSIIKQPVSDTVQIGDNAVFTVEATGNAPPTFLWMKIGVETPVGTSTSHSITSVSLSDTGRYYCIISNPGGTVFSDTVRLAVKHIPPSGADIIPDSLTVFTGSTTRFTVTSIGSGPFTYAWYKVREGGDSLLPANSDTLIINSAGFSDNGRYYCIVSNPGGADTSDTSVLIVSNIPPSGADISPDTVRVYEGDSAKLRIAVQGTPPFTFNWRKIKTGTDSIFTINSDSLYFSSVSITDSGAYYCIVSNPGGADTSDTVFLIVNHRAPRADFTMSPVTGAAPLSVVFTDASSGTIESRIWRFGDEVISSDINPVHIYTTPGLYTVTLIVSGPGGTDSVVKKDSIFVYAGGANPVWVTATYLYGNRVAISLNALDQIDTLEPPPVCDSLGLWLKAGGLPSAAADAILLKSYKKNQFSKKTINDTIELPGSDSLYGLMSGIFWNDGTVSDFLIANGVIILLRDTVPPSNFVIPLAEHIASDSVRVVLGNFASIDTIKVDSVCIWYGTDTISISLRGRRTQWYDIKSLSVHSNPSVIITDSLFTGARKVVYVAVTLKGKNGRYSNSNINSFNTLGSLPRNPLILRAEALSPTSIILKWNSITSDIADRLRIWYGTDTIGVGVFDNENLFDSISLPVSATSVIVSNLSEKTTYHFAVQVSKQNLWSMITENSRTTCTTPEDTTGKPQVNPLRIDTLFFDSLAALIRIKICIDSLFPTHDCEVGIAYSLKSYPSVYEGNQTVAVLSRCIDTIIMLNEPLRFDTLYYVAVWFRRQGGPWIDPTTASRKTVRTGIPFRQVVSLFDPNKQTDTVTAFNGSVLFWKDITYTDRSVVTDTVEIVRLKEIPEGAAIVGKPFTFKKSGPILPFYIGILIDSLPSGMSIYDVRIYSDSAGNMRVYYDTKIDSINRIVYIRTSDLRFPFIAMIDEMKPQIIIFSDTSSVISSSKPLKDSLRITDNIANVRWKYLFGRGDEPPKLRMEKELDEYDYSFSLTVPDSVHAISSESGLRALLIVSDGVHIDTINLSRSVLRYESDKLTTSANMFTPVYSTAILKSKSVDRLVSLIARHYKSNNYDRRYMLLFRWCQYEGNAKDDKKWVEYDQTDKAVKPLFDLEPGRIVWIKTRDNTPIHLDSGYTLSLKKPFEVELPSRQWTDFGMPYRFSVKIGDIISATGTEVDSIQFYRWKRDSVSKIFFLEPLYIYGIREHFDRSTTLDYTQGSGYSMFNTSSGKIILKIPPTLVSASGKTAKTAQTDNGSWSVKFNAQTSKGSALPSVYLGYSPKVKGYAYPLPPSFFPVEISVFDRRTKKHYGHLINEESEQGLIGEILINNGSDSMQTLRYYLDRTGAFPEKYSAYCFDASSKSLDSNGIINVNSNSFASRWIIAGDEKFIDNFIKSIMSLKFILHSPYPNPFRSKVNILYTVPFGSQEIIRITIYNMLGKKVWEKTIEELLPEGNHIAVWNGSDLYGRTAGSGLYIVNLTVINNNGKAIKRFERRITKLR